MGFLKAGHSANYLVFFFSYLEIYFLNDFQFKEIAHINR